jgi:hypothetical protein
VRSESGFSTASLDIGEYIVRLWSIHPKYLDQKGLVALWREALLAQSVLRDETTGYRNHPQLERFKSCSSPLLSISAYLKAVHVEASFRGYSFNASKIGHLDECGFIPVTSGQLELEWHHLLLKLSTRNPGLHRKWRDISSPDCHPLFEVHIGVVEQWERVRADA